MARGPVTTSSSDCRATLPIGSWKKQGRAVPSDSMTAETHGALLVGSPQQVIDKILYQHQLFGHTRFLAQMSLGAMPHNKVLHSMELLGTKVAPEVKKYLRQGKN